MIRSFQCKKTERLFRRERVREFAGIASVALRRLVALDGAQALSDLLIPPSNRLESLSGDRKGLPSIRIDDQYRICFTWRTAMPKMSKSRNTTDKLRPVHPGEILKETLDDLEISMNRLSKEIRVPANRISSIIAGQRAITGETALRLARYFETTPEYWLNMQARYDLETARDVWEGRVKCEVRPRHAA